MVKHSIIVRADWDDESGVWVATSSDIDGLAIEADTIESLSAKLPGALSDLIELNGFNGPNGDIPVFLHADRVLRVPSDCAA